MGDDSEGPRKDRSNITGSGRNVQGIGTVGVTLWKQELGGDWGNVQGPDKISLSSGTTDHGDNGKTWGRQRVGLSSGRGGDGLRGAPPHNSIHKEAAYNHIGEGGLPAFILNVHGGRENAGDYTDGALVGSRGGK